MKQEKIRGLERIRVDGVYYFYKETERCYLPLYGKEPVLEQEAYDKLVNCMAEAPAEGQALFNWKQGGTKDLSGWIMGKPVACNADLKVGSIYLAISEQFDAVNLIIVESHTIRNSHATFINPKDPKEKRLPDDRQMVIWPGEVETGIYYHVHPSI